MNTKKNSTIALCLTAIWLSVLSPALRRLLPRSAVKPSLCGEMRWDLARPLRYWTTC